MKNHTPATSENIFVKIHDFIEETDIRILVFAPPIISFLGLLIGVFMIDLLTDGPPYPPIVNILLGVLLLFPCFSGYAEVYKREMPALLGGVYKGNLAIVSGVFIIILFGFFGIAALIQGISTLLHQT